MAEKKNISSGAEKAEKLAKKKNVSTGATKKTDKNSVKSSGAGRCAKKSATADKKTKKVAPSAVTDESAAEAEKKLTGAKKTAKRGAKIEKRAVKDKSGRSEKREERRKKREERRKALKMKREKRGKKQRVVSEKRAEKIKRRAEKKQAHAQVAAMKKQARLDRKLAHKEAVAERKAMLKDRREERREARKERRDLLKSESKAERRERIAEEKQAKREAREQKHKAYLAEKKAKREHALKVRAEKRAARAEKQDRRTPGFGGWLAAVISLGVTTLALGTIVTFGWIEMDNMQANQASGYTQSLYELNSVVDNLDANLSRARVTSSSKDRVRVLSDIAIQSETAETILERFPIDLQMTEQFSSFINKMSGASKSMLYTVANGGELTSSQKKALNYMYETNAKVKEEINRLVSSCNEKDLINAMRGKSSALGDGFATIQNNTFETPKGIQDGPFSDSVKKTNPLALKGQKEITAQTAENTAMEYFAKYKPSAAKCTGEVTGEALALYNVNLTTPDGEMFVQLSKLGGKVVAFDSYKDCSDKNFSVDRCVAIAEDFLASIGYDGLKPVWTSENGTTCNLNFAPVQGGAVLYPDLVKVKVCEERGLVTGVEALSYVLNHGKRSLNKPSISEAHAMSCIDGNVEITSSRLAVIPLDGEEVLCYEFIGTFDGGEYYVYVDAATGEEVEVLTVIGTAQGRALM